MQTGFGAFVTVYLVENLWPPQAIGFALTVATMSSLLSQIPAGAALDSMRDKRGAVLLGIAGVGLAALLLCVTAARGAVYLALAVQGLASSLIGPGIAAISLALVGRAALSERIGRNARFAAIGNGLAAGGGGGHGRCRFLPSGGNICVSGRRSAGPACVAVAVPDRRKRCGAGGSTTAAVGPAAPGRCANHLTRHEVPALRQAARDFRRLCRAVIRRRCGDRTCRGRTGDKAVARLRHTDHRCDDPPAAGDRGSDFTLDRTPRRSLGSAATAVSGAIFGVTMTVVAADLTRRTGCFNLTLGALGVAISVGASLSTFFTGISAALFGARIAVLGLALVGLCGLLLLWASMPETREHHIVPDESDTAEA